MNSCVLMAEVIEQPELRYTQDGQTPVTTMLVQFASLRSDDPVNTLRVIGWGGMAQKIQDECKTGDRLIIEGRLSMNTIDRPEGFKEKRAELNASRIYAVQGDIVDHPTQSASATTPTASPRPVATPIPAPAPATPTAAPLTPPLPADDPGLDEVPF
ncbi:single-stranded DNA-binding protein [Candidatus Synechococcus calcipolaris G9]|uniref:Single-stranded DNA-binding protein n=1 Tax=Candidatus Synechococcus calcipolaris G9 TaxID=1497997 RepID=A0ABT6F0I7_9SYNE|nr:single-stranded DNA-binding protein [Candidatus Synechococcus calcipolaris]MDG2991313.1 single-stranded DNA-binding protein [Candidatus Synechococcus calcipolaris G9]